MPLHRHQRVDEKWAWESLCYDGRRDLPTGEEEVTYGHFRRLPLTSLNRRNTDFKKTGKCKSKWEKYIQSQMREIQGQMREIQSQMREIQIATGEKEVTYGRFRRLPLTSTSLYRSDSLTSSLSEKTPWLSKTSRRPAEHQMLPQPMLKRCQIRKFFIIYQSNLSSSSSSSANARFKLLKELIPNGNHVHILFFAMSGWCGVWWWGWGWWWWWGGGYLPCWISTLPEVPVAPRAVNELDVGRPLNVDLLSFSRAANIFQRNSQDLLPTHSPHSPLEMNSITLYLGRAGESLINSMILLNAISLGGWMWTIVTMMMVSTLRAYPMSQHGARYLISRFPSMPAGINASTKFDTNWYFRICGPLQIEVWSFSEYYISFPRHLSPGPSNIEPPQRWHGRRLWRKHWIFCPRHFVSRPGGVRCPPLFSS